MQQLQNIEDFLCANLGHGQRQAILHPLMLYHLAARQLLCPWREYHTGTAEDWRRRRDLADLNGDGYGLLSKTCKLSQHGSRVSKATCTKPRFVNQTVVETATYSTTSQWWQWRWCTQNLQTAKATAAKTQNHILSIRTSSKDLITSFKMSASVSASPVNVAILSTVQQKLKRTPTLNSSNRCQPPKAEHGLWTQATEIFQGYLINIVRFLHQNCNLKKNKMSTNWHYFTNGNPYLHSIYTKYKN